MRVKAVGVIAWIFLLQESSGATYCEGKGNESRSRVEKFVGGTRKYLINAILGLLVRPDLLFEALRCVHHHFLPTLPTVRLELLIRLRVDAAENEGGLRIPASHVHVCAGPLGYKLTGS